MLTTRRCFISYIAVTNVDRHYSYSVVLLFLWHRRPLRCPQSPVRVSDNTNDHNQVKFSYLFETAYKSTGSFFNLSVIVFLTSCAAFQYPPPQQRSSASLRRRRPKVLQQGTETDRTCRQTPRPVAVLKAQSTAIPAVPEAVIRANKQQSEERSLGSMRGLLAVPHRCFCCWYLHGHNLWTWSLLINQVR